MNHLPKLSRTKAGLSSGTHKSPLDSNLKADIWSNPESPPEKSIRISIKRIESINRKLSDPKIDFFDLKKEIDSYAETGLLSKENKGLDLKELVSIGVEIDEGLQELARQDPWSQKQLVFIGRLERLMDRFQGRIRHERGWIQAVEERQIGIRAWSRIEEAWTIFRHRFDRFSTVFYKPDHWQDFVENMKNWCRALEHWCPDLKWDLPKASQSIRWTTLVAEWEESNEGRLWLEHKNLAPDNLNDLYAIYKEMLDQIMAFEALHRRLLIKISGYTSDKDGITKDIKSDCEELCQTIPLTKPVQNIRQQLLLSSDSPISDVCRC